MICDVHGIDGCKSEGCKIWMENKSFERLRFYHAYDPSGEHLAGIIATTARKAKEVIYQTEYSEDLGWIEISIKWVKNADITGFKPGIFNENNDCFEGIKRKLFSSQGEDCDCCDAYSECSEFLENN